MKKVAMSLGVLAALGTACGDGDEPRAVRRERLEIRAESPTFEGRAPFAEVGPTRWRDAIVQGDLRTVQIRYSSGNPACFGADHAVAVYEERHVVLTLFTGRTDGVCTLERVTHTVTVRLSEPALDRDIVDGAAGRQSP